MDTQKAIRRWRDPVRTSAVFERRWRLVPGAPSETGRCQTADRGRAGNNQSISGEGRIVPRERAKGAGGAGRSGEKLGRNGPGLQHVFHVESETGAFLLRLHRIP